MAAGIYLDNNATTRVDPRVVEKMSRYFCEDYGNAASIHTFGQRARAAVEDARGQVARSIGAQPNEIVFTSGGTEADNAAVLGAVRRRSEKGRHVVTTSIEHPAVLKACDRLKDEGFEVTAVAADSRGVVSDRDVVQAMRPDTVLVSVMYANNETGAIQPVSSIAQEARARRILMHCDAVQAIGKIPVDVAELGVDLLSLSAHKFHGPKGVGALYVRKGTTTDALLVGGSHERGRRAGTENVPGIAGLGEACRLAREGLGDFRSRIGGLRDRLEKGLLAIPDTVRNGPADARVPHTCNVSFLGVEGETLLISLDFEGIAVSTGAACSSGSLTPSHVLSAMRLPNDRIQGAIRFSLGRFTTEAEIGRVLKTLPGVVSRIREMSFR